MIYYATYYINGVYALLIIVPNKEINLNCTNKHLFKYWIQIIWNLGNF